MAGLLHKAPPTIHPPRPAKCMKLIRRATYTSHMADSCPAKTPGGEVPRFAGHDGLARKSKTAAPAHPTGWKCSKITYLIH